MIENIITRIGVQQQLIIDNGKNFKGKEMKYFCKKFYINQKFSLVYYAQGNGKIEASNKTIKSILLKIWDRFKRDWYE